MYLSLSVRIAEGFLSKENPILDLAEVAEIACSSGYDALCMRASQIGIDTPESDVQDAVAQLQRRKLSVSMVTGDFAIVYNNTQGPLALRDIRPYVVLAKRLGAPLIRVALKETEDIPWARKAAEQASAQGVRLAHQCHTLSLFETVDSIERTLRAIDHPNFGLIYEPANLEICGQDYGSATIARLAPWIFNVYLQNQQLRADGRITLKTWCRGPVALDVIQIHEPGGIDFDAVFRGLHEIGYDGPVTVHQSAPEGTPPGESAAATAAFLRAQI